jgi:hypothetical protein
MRRHRLLRRTQTGSAPIEFVFGALFVCVLLLGIFEISFALYGRNVIASSAHEAARTAIELGGTSGNARWIARETVERAAGGLISDYEVNVTTRRIADRVLVEVHVSGAMDLPGPVPMLIPVDVDASATREALP